MTRYLVLNDLDNPRAHSQRCAMRCMQLIGRPNSSARYLRDRELADSIGAPDDRLTTDIDYALLHRDSLASDFQHAAKLRVLLHAVLDANPTCHCFVLGNSGQVIHGIPLKEVMQKLLR